MYFFIALFIAGVDILVSVVTAGEAQSQRGHCSLRGQSGRHQASARERERDVRTREGNTEA